MKIRYFIKIVLSIAISCINAIAQQNSDGRIINKIQNLDSGSISFSFHNTLDINNNGGHLQGIQLVNYKGKDYYFLTGSSSTYSYYSVVKPGKQNMVISINKILEKPYKHAGGFQIYKDLMAVGIEDNNAKNKSKVFIFSIGNPEKLPDEPLAIIERMGTYKRATAGCVGITIIKEKILVIVGDWDTEHLDFYRIDYKNLAFEGIELEYSIDTKKMDKSDWIDENWLSYQNINFINSESGIIYMAGMSSNSAGDDVVDLFEVESSEELSTFDLRKIYSRKFNGNDQTKFRWGAGIHYSDDEKMQIISCGVNIEESSTIRVYK